MLKWVVFILFAALWITLSLAAPQVIEDIAGAFVWLARQAAGHPISGSHG